MAWLEKYHAMIDCHLVILLMYLTRRKDKVKLEDAYIVRDYTDVFPEELPGIPPEREVEFKFNLLPSTSPISMAPYRTTPVK
ncbi:hypothetical protein LIER_26413 [Lithospermum erythrorhizon]|uniref:Uncharacterized protein n=1 Tax=Lithospermum erythrorhizon TaxID=34254 RepID=A0AAV3R895_LITER